MRSRKLVLCDIENLAGGALTGPVRVQAAADAFGAGCMSAAIAPDDLVVVASHPGAAFAVHALAPKARLLVGRGRHGADRCLLNEMREPQRLAHQFGHVVLLSGDGIFTERIDALNRAGLRTVVVARHGSIAASLRLAAHRTITIPLTPTSSIAA